MDGKNTISIRVIRDTKFENIRHKQLKISLPWSIMSETLAGVTFAGSVRYGGELSLPKIVRWGEG